MRHSRTSIHTCFHSILQTMSDVEVLESEIAALREQLADKQSTLNTLRTAIVEQSKTIGSKEKLTNEEIGRYARQIILPEVGVKGQLALKNASILIVGAGGLGTYIKYLASDSIVFSPRLYSSISYRLSVGIVFVWRWYRSHWYR